MDYRTGRFGLSLALELTKAGKQVIVLEIEEEKLNAVKDQLENIYPVKAVTEEVLHESGISHCRTAIVCIGKDIESNILVTMSLIELGIPRVIAKATSVNHGKVLEHIGAEAVFPEVEMGERLARSLVSTGTLDFLESARTSPLPIFLSQGHLPTGAWKRSISVSDFI